MFCLLWLRSISITSFLVLMFVHPSCSTLNRCYFLVSFQSHHDQFTSSDIYIIISSLCRFCHFILFLFNKFRRDERPLLPRSLVRLCLCILIIIEKYADGRNGRFKGTTFRKISLAEEVPLIILHDFE